MKNSRIHLGLLSALLLALCLTAAPAVAGSHDSAAADPKAETVRIVVPLAPGGVYDFWARVAARHLGKHLPGRPTILVQNMPGGGGYIGMNFLYKAAPRDGSTIGMVLADLYTAITGIGYLISRYASIYRTDAMFVPVATLGLLGITLTSVLRFIEKRVAPWMHQEEHE